jgi:hypothetical protein
MRKLEGMTVEKGKKHIKTNKGKIESRKRKEDERRNTTKRDIKSQGESDKKR